LPFFYDVCDIPHRSFNDQRKWFLKPRGRRVDPAYAEILERSTAWFTQCKGTRDSLTHFLGRHQLGYTVTETLDGEVVDFEFTASLHDKPDLTEDPAHENTVQQLKEVVEAHYRYLEATMLHFLEKLGKELRDLGSTLGKISTPLLRLSSQDDGAWVYPEAHP
jgi:hypothetical protein